MSATFNKRGRRPARAPRAASLLAVLTFLVALGSCGQPDPVDETVYPVSASFDAADASAWTAAGPSVRFATYAPADRNEEVSFTASGLVPGKAWLVVTNADPGASFELSGTLANAVPEARTAVESTDTATADTLTRYLRDIPAVSEFNADPWAYVEESAISSRAIVPSAPVLSTSALYEKAEFSYLIVNSVGELETVTAFATCKAYDTDTTTGISAAVWVLDSLLADSTISQTMIDAVISKFLVVGSDNDIHDWVSSVFGDSYSTPVAARSDALITDADVIDILIADIGQQDIKSGIIGYFHSLHNYQKRVFSDSNERVMFFIDAPILADPSGGKNSIWEPTDIGPMEIWSTLAHELQHMIHFNEKFVERESAQSPTWYDETCSAAAEDLVSYKLAINGPRGVSWDRADAGDTGNQSGLLPYFVWYPEDSLTYWPSPELSTMHDYGSAYAFAAWLGRNYGPQVFQGMVQSLDTGFQALENAIANLGYVKPDESTLLRDWAVASIGSTFDPVTYPMEIPYRFNSGTWFTGTVGSTTYQVGSIGLNRYRQIEDGSTTVLHETGLKILSDIPSSGSIAPAANLYIALPVAADGTAAGTLTLYRGMSMTVVVSE
ncbi:MAG: hypothetical protein JXA15_01865 [Spirochaetales bacterium]|nr:hypothetical protein [Spirochaetales bacterium]